MWVDSGTNILICYLDQAEHVTTGEALGASTTLG